METDMTDAGFLACLPFTLAQECPIPYDWSNPENFSNDAHDPGGETMCGIIQREYDAYRKSKGLPTRDVRNLTQDEGEDIYLNSYWLPHCPSLPIGLALCLFDANVNEGSTEGTKILQFALGIVNDGDWGSETAAAVAAISDLQNIIVGFTARRETVYREMRGFQYFGKDWLRRASEIGRQALKMTVTA
jgi:lysozyme family protein